MRKWYPMLRGLPSIDPRRANYAEMQGGRSVVHLVLTLMAAVHLIVPGGRKRLASDAR